MLDFSYGHHSVLFGFYQYSSMGCSGRVQLDWDCVDWRDTTVPTCWPNLGLGASMRVVQIGSRLVQLDLGLCRLEGRTDSGFGLAKILTPAGAA